MLPPKKPIDVKQKIYHFFKRSDVYYILYDDLMDLPIQYGALNVVLPAVHSVQKNVEGSFVIFYERDTKHGWKRNDGKTNMNNRKK